MGKYDPLQSFLAERSESEVPMSFQDIENIIRGKLPPSAYRHRPWWSNNPKGSVITYAWLGAGYKTERVDLGGQKLVFRRDRSRSAGGADRDAPGSGGGPAGGWLDRFRARMSGTVRVAPGVNLCEPAVDPDDWDANR